MYTVSNSFNCVPEQMSPFSTILRMGTQYVVIEKMEKSAS